MAHVPALPRRTAESRRRKGLPYGRSQSQRTGRDGPTVRFPRGGTGGGAAGRRGRGPALAPWPRPYRLLRTAASGGLDAGRGAARTPRTFFQGGGRSARGGAAGPATSGAAESRGVGGGRAMARAAQVSAARRLRGPPPSAGRYGLRRRRGPLARRPVPLWPRGTRRCSGPRIRRGPAGAGPPGGAGLPSLILGSPSSLRRPRPGRARPPPPPADHCEVRAGGRVGGPGETPGAAAVASSCRRHRRPLHRLPCSDLAGRGERDAAWGPAPVPHPVKG